MKNMKGFASTAATREVRGIGDVFREEPAMSETEDPWMMTSMRLHSSVRNRIKVYAFSNGLRMQDVIDEVLRVYLDSKGA